MLKLHILPVYSEQHPTYQIGPMQLLKHQVATYEAFKDPDIDVIFNTAMTGDGKSLAAYLPVFQQQKHIIAMYPTNELVQDQYNALPGYRRRLDIKFTQCDILCRYLLLDCNHSRESERARSHDRELLLTATQSCLRQEGIPDAFRY